jgi:DNA repair exonuclease SbcCD nuclease subunit
MRQFMRNRRPLRAVHTSDVHLGAYTGPSAFAENHNALSAQAFMRVIDLANRQDADLLLIAGDFFDNDRVPDELVWFAAEEIGRFRGHTVICPGNHDAVDPGRIYWRHSLESRAPRLHVIRDHLGEIVELPHLDAVVWGRAALDADWQFRPLVGIPGRVDDRWHIAMAHGHYIRDEYDRHRSMLIEPAEISAAAEHWDYLALGHWDPHTDVSTDGLTALYSGAPLSFSEGHQAAGWAVVVDFDDHGVRWTTHRVDPREAPA